MAGLVGSGDLADRTQEGWDLRLSFNSEQRESRVGAGLLAQWSRPGSSELSACVPTRSIDHSQNRFLPRPGSPDQDAADSIRDSVRG